MQVCMCSSLTVKKITCIPPQRGMIDHSGLGGGEDHTCMRKKINMLKTFKRGDISYTFLRQYMCAIHVQQCDFCFIAHASCDHTNKMVVKWLVKHTVLITHWSITNFKVCLYISGCLGVLIERCTFLQHS